MSVVTRIRTSQELTVPFTPEEVWGVLADIAAYPAWWPARLGVEILHHPGELLGAEFEVRPLMGRIFRIRFEEIEGTSSMRLRFFGGALEGPGGFHLLDLDGSTQVRYEMDVFARGLDVAVLSRVLPFEWIHRSRMRSVLNRLAGRLESLRRAAGQERVPSLPLPDGEGALRWIEEEEAARRAAEEQVRRRAEEEALARVAARQAERRAAEEAVRRVVEEEADTRAREEPSQAAREASDRALTEAAVFDAPGEIDNAAAPAEPGDRGSRLRTLWSRLGDWLRDAPAAAPKRDSSFDTAHPIAPSRVSDRPDTDTNGDPGV